jgi:hypothetical protein
MDTDDWYRELQTLFAQAVGKATSSDWLKENSSIIHEIWNVDGKFDVERFECSEQEIRVYARIGPSLTSVYDLRCVIYQVLAPAVEEFFVLVPLHTPECWQFWFVTGGPSHGHSVKIMVERAQHPHIRG